MESVGNGASSNGTEEGGSGVLLLHHNMPLILSMLQTTTSKHEFIHEKPRILQDFDSYILLLFFSYTQILFRIF